MWIVKIGDIVSSSVPTHFDDAAGVLSRLDISHRGNGSLDVTAWWLDGSAVAWPMPGRFDYTAGHDRPEVDTLARAVALLAQDATTELTPTTVRQVPDAEPRYQALREMLVQRAHATSFGISTRLGT